MWRFALFLLILALVSGGLSFACQSAAASGLAAMLFVAFAALCGLIFVPLHMMSVRAMHGDKLVRTLGITIVLSAIIGAGASWWALDNNSIPLEVSRHSPFSILRSCFSLIPEMSLGLSPARSRNCRTARP